MSVTHADLDKTTQAALSAGRQLDAAIGTRVPNQSELERAVVEYCGGIFRWNARWGAICWVEKMALTRCALPDEPRRVREALVVGLTALWGGLRSDIALKRERDR